RPHAARGVRRAPRAAEPARRRRPRALPRHRQGRVPEPRRMSLRVLRAGILTTVQDRGRHGFQHVGLCPGGALDPVSLALGNAMVGNPPDAAALELTVLGPELLFEADTLVAICGAEFDASIPINRPVLVEAGTRVAIGRATRGARSYLAVAGGIA